MRHEHSANNAHNVKILIFTSSSFPGRSSKCSWGVRSKNENDSGGPRERKPRPRRGSFLVARNRSSIVLVLVLVLVSAIGCKGEDVGVPKSNKLALMGLKPRAEPSRSLRGEEPSKQMLRPEGARDAYTFDLTFDLPPLQLQGAPSWDGVPGVETP